MNNPIIRCFRAAIVFIALATFLTGCALHTGPAMVGVVTEGGAAVASVPVESTGWACSHNVLGVVAFGDSSVDTAKMDGDISEVATVDRKYFNVLFFYGRACTIVRGR
jgi:hypothetical protein